MKVEGLKVRKDADPGRKFKCRIRECGGVLREKMPDMFEEQREVAS